MRRVFTLIRHHGAGTAPDEEPEKLIRFPRRDMEVVLEAEAAGSAPPYAVRSAVDVPCPPSSSVALISEKTLVLEGRADGNSCEDSLRKENLGVKDEAEADTSSDLSTIGLPSLTSPSVLGSEASGTCSHANAVHASSNAKGYYFRARFSFRFRPAHYLSYWGRRQSVGS